jgi:spore maturation protein CgeB
MRILKTSSPYEEYVQGVYQSRPGLTTQAFGVQQEALLDGFFGWADAWKHYLEATGRFVVEDVVINAAPARQAWARALAGRCETPTIEAFTEQLIAEYRPDIWFCHTSELGAEFRTRMRRLYPFLRLVIGYDGTRNHRPDVFRGCDTILTCLEDTAAFYRAAGFESRVLRYGFDERVLNRVDSRESRYDVSFVGGLRLARRAHNFRIDVLQHIDAAMPVEVWLAKPPTLADVAIAAAGYARRGQTGHFLRHLRRSVRLPRLIRRAHSAVFGIDMYRVLADSRVTLNVHIDAAGDEAANIRLFEATGIGACLVTDWKSTLASIFRADEEVVTFRTPNEAVDKVRYLLSNPSHRLTIAQSGQRRTLADHAVKSRLLELVPMLESA